MQKHLLLLVFFVAACAALASAQKPTPMPPWRRYATQLRLRQLQEQPGVPEAMAAVERFTAAYRPLGEPDTVLIALVFHLLPLPGAAAGPAAEDLEAQLRQLNTDFCQPAHPYLARSYQQAFAFS